MEEGLIALLLGTAAIADQIDDRLYPGVRPQGSPLPALVLNVFPRPPQYTHQGACRVGEDRIQVDALAATYTEMRALRRVVRARLSGFKGVVEGVEFQGVFDAGGGGDSFEHAPPDRIHRHSMDFIVRAVEPQI